LYSLLSVYIPLLVGVRKGIQCKKSCWSN